MTPTVWTLAVLVSLAMAGLVAAGVFAWRRRGRPDQGKLGGGTVVARAFSYAVLAGLLACAVAVPRPGVAAVVLLLGTLALWEWSRLADLPIHHVVGMLAANVVMVATIYFAGVHAADWLIAGLVLIGMLWPVIRADTGRAVRDLGFAALGFVSTAVMLVHGVALTGEHGEAGVILFAALAIGCAGSDVGAFLVGRRFGRTPLAPRLSPAKTRAGVVGNFAGAALGLALLAPALVPALASAGVPAWYGVLLVPIVAVGSVWGDLFKSAVKREAGVKDAGHWLPGFGGILDRIDSLLITLPLAYWALRIIEALGGSA